MTRHFDTIDDLTAAIAAFADARDWRQFHNPKNLLLALMGELGELAEHFQWLTTEQASKVSEDSSSRSAIEDEVADVAIYLLRLADELNVDLATAIRAKLARNETRFRRSRRSVRQNPEMISGILSEAPLFTPAHVLQTPSPVPREAGLYGWYFREVPPVVPTDDCRKREDATLLYAGVAPRRPPADGRPPSMQTLRDRIRSHLTGNASGSTLRLTLGCLLGDVLGIELRRVGRGSRMTWTREGEIVLNEWLQQNALVCWETDPSPWDREEVLIREVSLPLNLDQNKHHGFHADLSARREAARQKARDLPIVDV